MTPCVVSAKHAPDPDGAFVSKVPLALMAQTRICLADRTWKLKKLDAQLARLKT